MSQERAARGGRHRRLGRSTTPENRTTAAQGSSAGHEVQPTRKFAAAPLGGAFAEPWSARKLVGLLAVFGPAAIVASVSIGAGETIVVVRAGAWARYGLLWLVLLSCVVKGVFVTYLLGRYTAVSGEHIGHRLVRLPGPRGWLLVVIVALEMIGAPLVWVPIAKPCGDLFHYLLQGVLPASIPEPVYENIITCAFIALALAFCLRLSYEKLEKQQILICSILVVGTIVGTLMVRPDLGEALLGTLRFGQVPEFPEWAPRDAVDNPLLTMATAFAYVGGTVMSYVVYANWVGMRRWGMTAHPEIAALRERAFAHDAIDYLPDDPAEVARVRKSVGPLRWDVGMGAVVLFIVTAAFMVSGAAVLYPLQSTFDGWGLLTEQRHVWSNIHGSLIWIYYIAIVAALWGTLQALPEVYARVMQEFGQAIRPHRKWSYDRIKRIVCGYLLVTTFIVVWLDVPFDILTQVAGFILANLAISLMMAAALYLNFKLPAAYRTRLPMLTGAVASALVLFAFAGISGWGLAGKLFGSG